MRVFVLFLVVALLSSALGVAVVGATMPTIYQLTQALEQRQAAAK